MKQQFKLILASALLAGVLPLSAQAQETIKIGVAQPLTGNPLQVRTLLLVSNYGRVQPKRLRS